MRSVQTALVPETVEEGASIGEWADQFCDYIEGRLEEWLKFKRNLTCMDSAQYFAYWYSQESTWEYWLNILRHGNETTKYQLYLDLNRRL